MLPPEDIPQLQRQTWAQSEGMQDDIPSKWEPKECRASHPISGKIKYQAILKR